ncbi:MAG: hypothetical protein P8P74_16995 [Crocinitomicaceae bacterium]|nr:hypothetical protein [Crocinitomicaceae bacterium]
MNTQSDGMSDQQRLKELVSIHDGTYQIRVSDEDHSPLLTVELFDLILSSREQDIDVILDINQHTKIFLPSASLLESNSFTPMETLIYVSESTNHSTISE